MGILMLLVGIALAHGADKDPAVGWLCVLVVTICVWVEFFLWIK